MHDKPLLIIVMLAVAAVALILVTGIGGFAKGGEFNRKYANKIMRWRIIAQAVAIAMILLYVTLTQA